MALTLFDGTDTIILPESLEWVDEYEWSDVKQDIQTTIGGGLVISESVVSAGRPITLIGGDNVWINKPTLDALMLLVNIVDKVYTLTFPDARTFQVVFDRSDNAVVAKPVFRQITQAVDANYTITLNLMEV